jgi:hypothetical protein
MVAEMISREKKAEEVKSCSLYLCADRLLSNNIFSSTRVMWVNQSVNEHCPLSIRVGVL